MEITLTPVRSSSPVPLVFVETGDTWYVVRSPVRDDTSQQTARQFQETQEAPLPPRVVEKYPDASRV